MQESSTLAVASLVTTISLAFIGYVISHLNDMRLEKKKARVKFIGDQLQYLYGPLLSLSNTTRVAWSSFRSQWHPEGTPYWEETTLEEKAERCLWIREVFMPLGVAMEKAIIENAHLISGGTVPLVLLKLLAHVEVYKITLKKWEANDYSSGTAYLNFPEEFDKYVEDEFAILKRRQAELLGNMLQRGA